MKRIAISLGILLALCPLTMVGAQSPSPGDVLSYHAGPMRDGNFTIPGLTWARARAIHPDSGFKAEIAGDINAQPLFWRAADGGSRLLVATENDTVYEIDAASGKTLWQKTLGVPVPRASLPCENIDPLGITGTPVIDAARQAVYLDAMIKGADGAPEHAVFGLSLRDGSILPGWPVNVAAALKAEGVDFDTPVQGERGALTIIGDTVYVPFGGHFGDCGAYRGWVVGVTRAAPHRVTSWHSEGIGAAVWSPAGISSDGSHLFVSTGNTMANDGGRRFAAPAQWGQGEAVIRLPADLHYADDPTQFFAPSDWKQMDDRDQDLGGIAPMLFDLSGRRLALALGKDGKAYLLDRDRPGGFGGALAVQQVSPGQIRGSAAAYPVGGAEFAAFQGRGSDCPPGEQTPAPARGAVFGGGPGAPPGAPAGRGPGAVAGAPPAGAPPGAGRGAPGGGRGFGGGGGITVVKVSASPAAITTPWCADMDGRGSPIVTTTDGHADPIVWIPGAEGDNRLYAFRGDTGEKLFTSDPLPGLQHFQTLIAVPGHLYIAGKDALYAFSF